MVSRSFSTPISVVADTQNYWNKLEEKLNKDISYALGAIRRNKRPYRFRPMSAQLRRYIHHFLAEEQDIITVSEGEGKWRKVVLKLVKPEEKAAHVAAEKAAAAQKEQTIEAPECVTEDTEHPNCVVTAESTNCPVENQANTPAQETAPQATVTPAPQAEVKPAETATPAPSAEQAQPVQAPVQEVAQPAQTEQPAQAPATPTENKPEETK